MYVLGVVGGIASGKSLVAQALAQCGSAVVVNADSVGHEVLADPNVIAAFRERWGDEVVGPDGQLVRREIANRVFGSEESPRREREFLNSVTHPRIRERLREELNALRAKGTPLVVLDAALLFETGWSQLCDDVVFVDVPREVRVQRAKELRGWSEDEFAAREASQWSVDEKRARCRWIIENHGTKEQLLGEGKKVLSAIQAEIAE